MKGVGFTGTQSGTSGFAQVRTVRRALQWGFRRHGLLFEHGDCIGWDALAHALARGLGAKIRGHPPDVDHKRARCRCDVVLPPRPYLVRNRNIVGATALLVAAPGSMHEELRSGTWSTVRYARKLERHIIICWPDGSSTQENDGRVIRL